MVIIAIRPIANPDTLGTDSIPVTCDGVSANITSNDSLGIGYVVVINIIDQPNHGEATRLGNIISYKPTLGYKGLDTLTYSITINGLSDTAVVIFKVDCPNDPCKFPEGFSPNGDGVNDYYTLYCTGAYNKSEMLIFNRWGNEVYHKKDGYNGEWDGTYRGQDLPDGTYYYVFKYNDGVNKAKSGFIVIQR
jgi:gliding motility-associated-like protein